MGRLAEEVEEYEGFGIATAGPAHDKSMREWRCAFFVEPLDSGWEEPYILVYSVSVLAARRGSDTRPPETLALEEGGLAVRRRIDSGSVQANITEREARGWK